jgi:hypothetical protein
VSQVECDLIKHNKEITKTELQGAAGTTATHPTICTLCSGTNRAAPATSRSTKKYPSTKSFAQKKPVFFHPG